MDVPVPLAPVKPGVEHGLTFPRSVADLLGFGVSKIESMPEAKTQSQKLRAKGCFTASSLPLCRELPVATLLSSASLSTPS